MADISIPYVMGCDTTITDHARKMVYAAVGTKPLFILELMRTTK
jgi:hypothetical protein